MARSGRSLSRRCAAQALYQWDLTGQPAKDIKKNFIKNSDLNEQHKDYFFLLIEEIPANVEAIDEVIAVHLDRKIEDVDLVERAILRLATYEFLYQQSLPINVVLDEAIELAKMFSAENSHKYVNGVLDKIAKEVRK